MEEPLVSVLIPCYNVENFVEEAVDSILKQTYKNLEIWLIDDGSTDNTRYILDKYSDARIKKFFADTNTKKVGCVNEVLRKVRGEYICFQDSDDISSVHRIKKQVKIFHENSDIGICFTGYSYFGEQKRNAMLVSKTNEDLIREFLRFKAHKNSNKDPTCCNTMMITRGLLQLESGYNTYFSGRVGEDIQWIYRILKHCKGAVVDEILYNYRMRQGSFTSDQFVGKNVKYMYSWNLLEKIIELDINDNIDLLLINNVDELKRLELEACEEALLIKSIELNRLKISYEKSKTFIVGKFLLFPVRFVVGFLKKN